MAWEACNSPRRGRSRKKPTGRVSSPCECLDPRTFDSFAAHRRVEDALKAISRQVRQCGTAMRAVRPGPAHTKSSFAAATEPSCAGAQMALLYGHVPAGIEFGGNKASGGMAKSGTGSHEGAR